MHYVIGIIIVLAGVWMVLKTEWILANFGTSSWAENKIGTSGGSRTLYKLIGIALIFVGCLVTFNLMQGFLGATIGKLFIRG